MIICVAWKVHLVHLHQMSVRVNIHVQCIYIYIHIYMNDYSWQEYNSYACWMRLGPQNAILHMFAMLHYIILRCWPLFTSCLSFHYICLTGENIPSRIIRKRPIKMTNRLTDELTYLSESMTIYSVSHNIRTSLVLSGIDYSCFILRLTSYVQCIFCRAHLYTFFKFIVIE